ncbi:MAG: hypothetical protein IMZ62_13505, partial [Chloroflexi bacterium]|nr:hypothetical protein [Chloroflexota bacterium]
TKLQADVAIALSDSCEIWETILTADGSGGYLEGSQGDPARPLTGTLVFDAAGTYVFGDGGPAFGDNITLTLGTVANTRTWELVEVGNSPGDGGSYPIECYTLDNPWVYVENVIGQWLSEITEGEVLTSLTGSIITITCDADSGWQIDALASTSDLVLGEDPAAVDRIIPTITETPDAVQAYAWAGACRMLPVSAIEQSNMGINAEVVLVKFILPHDAVLTATSTIHVGDDIYEVAGIRPANVPVITTHVYCTRR